MNPKLTERLVRYIRSFNLPIEDISEISVYLELVY